MWPMMSVRSVNFNSLRFIAVSVFALCLSVFCLSVRLHISKNTSTFQHIFCACYVWLWLGLSLTAMQYVMYLRFFLDDDMFPRMGENQKRRVCFVQFARWPNLGRSLPSPIASCLFKNALRIYKADIEENV